MADTRTLKLSLLADVQKFLSGMDKAEKGTKGFSSSIGKYSKAMAKSFALAGVAAGAYAIKLGVDGVKSAVEDEKSQAQLAKALKNTTNATDAQIASTEEYISKTQLRYGVADVKLRASLGNLLRATGDLTESQRLNNLAVDVSAATGKDLETISLALARAYGGNIGALKRLGIPLDDNIVKTKDFEAATDELQRLFGGAAAANTETLEGKLAILRETFGELQEGIGQKFIPILKNLLDNVTEVSRAFSGEDPEGLSARARELKGEVGDTSTGSLGRSLKILADSFGTLFKAFSEDGDSTTDSMQELANALNNIAKGINAIADAYRKAKSLGGTIVDWLTIDPNEGPKFADSRFGQALGYTNRAGGGGVMANRPYMVGEFGPELFVPSGSGSIRPNGGTGGSNTFIFNGVIDGESARRSIERLMQTSSKRTGAVNLAGSYL